MSISINTKADAYCLTTVTDLFGPSIERTAQLLEPLLIGEECYATLSDTNGIISV